MNLLYQDMDSSKGLLMVNKNQEVEEKWSRLTKVLKEIERRDEEAILIGDINKLVGNDKSGIKDNNQKVSFGGKLVLESIS